MKKRSLILIGLIVVILAVVVAVVCTMCGKGGEEVKQGLTLSSTELELDALEKAELTAVVTDANGNPVEAAVTWSTDNAAVATVDNGKITALTAGTATITAQYNGMRAQCAVRVSAIVRPVMVFAKTSYEVGKGTTNQIIPTVRLKSSTLDAKEYGITYSFTTQDPEIATVNDKGVITGVKVGKTYITVKANCPLATAAGIDGELTTDVEVVVVPDYTLSIALADGYTEDIYLQEVTVEETVFHGTLLLNVLEGRYEEQDIREEVTFVSSDTEVVTVSEDGTVSVAPSAQEGDTADVWAQYVTPSEGEVNSNRITVTVCKAIIDKELTSELLIDLSTGGSINTYTVFGHKETVVDVYDAEDAQQISLWDIDKGGLDEDQITQVGERELVILGEKIGYRVKALVVTRVIRTPSQFISTFLRSNNIANIKADGYYVLGGNIDMTGVPIIGRGWYSGDGCGLVGTFDGRGYTINGFELEQGGGIFGVISSEAILKNIAFTNVKVNSNGHAVVLGYAVYGTVQDVYVGISELSSTYNATSATIGLFAQANANNVLKNIVVVNSADIEPGSAVINYGTLEASTNKGAWENVMVVSVDRMFGGTDTAGDAGAAGYSKSVQRFSTMSKLLGSDYYQQKKAEYSESIWNRGTMTFWTSRYYFQEELNELPNSLEISVKEEETLLVNHSAFVITTNSSKLKISDGKVIATKEIPAGDKAWIKVVWGNYSKTISVKTKWEVQTDVIYDLNISGQTDLVVSGLPVNQENVKVYFKKTDGTETELNASCIDGKLIVSMADILAVQSTLATGDNPIRVDVEGEDDLYINGVKLVWVIHNATELLEMKSHLLVDESVYTGYLALGADVDLNGVAIKNSGLMNQNFAGIFDGRFYEISNLNADTGNIGLFGNVSGTIRNLRVVNATVSSYTGAVVGGSLNGTLEYIYVEGSVTKDGMASGSNLANFGAGLLAARIEADAKINNVIVNAIEIGDDLRLATAFGKLHGDNASISSFTSCYAVNASGETYMPYKQGWVKKSFSGSGNVNFATMDALWEHTDAAILAEKLGLISPANETIADITYDLNAIDPKDLIISGLPVDSADVKVSVKGLNGGEIVLNASCNGGNLVISKSDIQAVENSIATGEQTLCVTAANAEDHYVRGIKLAWMINTAEQLLKIKEHMAVNGATCDGMFALGANIDLTGVTIKNNGLSGTKFTGVFDGRLYEISNLNADTGNIGLFGNVSGTVKNLRIVNATVSSYTATIVGGSLTGKLENIYVQGSIIKDGMGETSNLSNFGAGLLAGRIEAGAKINNVIVELSEIADNLRLATAFGKLHGGYASEDSFTNCYAVGADGCSYMPYDQGWVKQSFTTGGSNKNFDSMWLLWEDAKAASLAEALGLSQPPMETVVDVTYYLNDAQQADLVIPNTGIEQSNVKVSFVALNGSQITVDATCMNGSLSVPLAAMQAVQDQLATGEQMLQIALDNNNTLTVKGVKFVWVLNTVAEWNAMVSHMTLTKADTYTGYLALGADLDMSGVVIGQGFTANKSIFNGVFDGRNHSITNVVANKGNIGLFTGLGSEGVIRNLKVVKATVSSYTGALVGGGVDGTIENVYIKGAITADAMSANSNLANFGAGLLAGRINAGARINNVIVELTSIADGLRLATGFGKLHGGSSSTASFTNCYAVNSAGCAYMPYNQGWVKQDLPEINGNKNFSTIAELLENDAAKALMDRLGGFSCEEIGHIYNDAWNSDVTGHYHVCVVSGCGAMGEIESHSFGDWVDTPVTESSNGTQYRLCTVCQYREERETPIEHIHNLVYVAAKEATCTDNGNIEHWYCGECQGYFADAEGKNATTQAEITVEQLAHTFNQFVATSAYLKSAPTESARAEYYKSCSCGLASTADIFYGNKAAKVDVNNGEPLVIEHDVFAGSGDATVTIGTTNLTASFANGKLTVADSVLKAASILPTGAMDIVVTYGDASATIEGIELIWVINNASELLKMKDHLTANGTTYTGMLALGADIDLANVSIKNSGFLNTTFAGVFDGRLYELANLNSNTGNIGLFSNVSGTVKNLRVVNATVSSYTAAIIGGGLSGTLENIYVQGSITADGMAATSNLSNFGSGLLAGRIQAGAKINNCIVELTSIADGLRLATACGKLHGGTASESSFTNCYAVNADGCTYMPYNQGWVKQSFTVGSSNKNFATMTDLLADDEAAALMAALEREASDEEDLAIEMGSPYDMNVTGGDLVITNAGLTGTLESVTVKDMEITLDGATLANGVLTVPATAFRMDTMPSGRLTLTVTTNTKTVEVSGDFIWVINNASELLKMKNHLIADGTIYTGSLALGANIDLTGVTIKNSGLTNTTFAGKFDGRLYTLSNLRANTGNVGLFANVSGTVKNLIVTDATVSSYTAAVVGGSLTGKLENIYVKGSITADGMAATSNLANFGSGLLVGRIQSDAEISSCIVEITSIADGLRLATAFGKLHGATATESVFANCYAVNAGGCTYMPYNQGWVKQSFTTGGTNKNFADISVLLSDSVASKLAELLGLC